LRFRKRKLTREALKTDLIFAPMSKQIYYVETFTTKPFQGSPVAVCLLEHAEERPWMLNIAAALNLPEAVFVVPRGPNRFDLRTMTTRSEIEPGASTVLAAASILFSKRMADRTKPITFFTHVGSISASIANRTIEMNFPAQEAVEVTTPLPLLTKALDREPQYVGQRGKDFLVLLSSESALKRVRPDFALLRQTEVQGLIVTAPAGASRKYDFAVRTFYPDINVGQGDPTTCSLHSMLGPFWMPRLGKTQLTGYRYARWGGLLDLTVDGDRIKFCGEAVTIFEGELKV